MRLLRQFPKFWFLWPPCIKQETFLIYSELQQKIIVTAPDSLPCLQVAIGSKTRMPIYQGGSGSNALLFRYTIEAGDWDGDGIKISSGINTSNSTIKDEVGNHASLTLNNVGSMSRNGD